MSYKLSITYKLPLIDAPNGISPISPVFDILEQNYAQDKSYTETDGDTVWDTKVIKNGDITSVRKTIQSSKSVYAANSNDFGEFDPEIYAHSDSSSPIPLHRFAEEVFPIATYDSDTDTYSAELTVNTKDSNPFTANDVDGTLAYYQAISEVVPNITVSIINS